MAQTALTRFSFLPRPRGGAFLLPCIRHGAGLLFYLAAIQTHAIVYSVFCAVHAVYTSHDIKQHTGLYRRFYCDYARSSAANTRPTQAAIIPPAPRWSVSQRPDGLHQYQIPPPRRTLYRTAQPPYYNKVYKSAAVRLLWIHARQCSIPQTMQARRGSSYRIRIVGKRCTRRTC